MYRYHAAHTTTLVIIITHYSRVLFCRRPSLSPFCTFPLAPRNNARKLDSLSFFKTRFATTFESILHVSSRTYQQTTKEQQQKVSTPVTIATHPFTPHPFTPHPFTPTWLETVRRSFCPIQCPASIEFLKSNKKSRQG